MVDLNSETKIQFEKGIFAIFRNNLNGLWEILSEPLSGHIIKPKNLLDLNSKTVI